jgi:colicin import membrane protein
VSKATEQNDKLKRAIIISVALHIILIALLIWSSFDEHLDASAGGGGDRPLMPSWSIRGRW